MRLLAISNLGVFILVGTCMLIGSAIANTRKGEFLPRTREDRVVVGLLTALLAVIIALVIYALRPYAHPSQPALEPVAVHRTPAATAPPKEPKSVLRAPNFATPNLATLTRDVSVPVLYGVVSIRTGTKVRIVSRTGSTLRIRYDGADYDIPVAATDAEVKHHD